MSSLGPSTLPDFESKPQPTQDPARLKLELKRLFEQPDLLPERLLAFLVDYLAINQQAIPLSQIFGFSTTYLRGRVGNSGNVVSGAGFTSVKNSTGNYTVTFDNPYPEAPIVIGSAIDGGNVMLTVTAVSTTAFTVVLGDHSGAETDDNFLFIVMPT